MRKYIAPLIAAVAATICAVLYFSIFVHVVDSLFVKIVYFVVVIAIILAMTVTLKRRFSEIKEEEKDDLSKY